MRLVMHDYSGHPFQLQLSRALARRGHDVTHQHCSTYTTGKGALERQPDDAPGFRVEAMTTGDEFARYDATKRVRQEVGYGRRLGDRICDVKPDVFVMCNIPLLANYVAVRRLSRSGVPLVFWLQDLYSRAISAAARDKLGPLALPIAPVADHLERAVARRSAAVVPISREFEPVLRTWGIADSSVTMIPNWGALDELPERPQDNAWSREHGLDRGPVVLYSGTLGIKHDPGVLLEMGRMLEKEFPGARMVVISQGRGRQWLEQELAAQPVSSMLLLDYQPYESLPDVLGSADVLVAVLESDASSYSVPSKVLSYLCAGRPILGVMPSENAASRILLDTGAGVVLDSGDKQGAVSALRNLLLDEECRNRMGGAARRYAEQNFKIDSIAAQFERVLEGARAGQPARDFSPGRDHVREEQ